MKKSIFFLTAAAVMLFSCEKEQDFTKVNQDVPEKTISFAVSHETDADASKTTIDSGGNVQWEAADKLGVVYDGGLVESSAAGAPGASASFTATIPGDKDALYLVYPSSITAGYESGSLKVTVPATQDGTFGSTAIQVAEYAQPTCSIKNLGGLLAITTTADVNEIVISSNNSTPLVGKATVSFTDGIPSVSSVESGSPSVRLSGLGGAGTYYVAVLPGSFDAGIYIELKKSGSAVGEKITGNTLNVVRRKIMKINVGDPGVIANKKFVTVAGAGLKDGSSWDNAMGSTEFYTFLTTKSTDNTVFMAAGTYRTQNTDGYSINTSTTGLKVFGGYPGDASGSSLSSRDITVNRTILSGDGDGDGTGENRIIVANGVSITAVFDGLEFRDAYRSNADIGSAIVVNNCADMKFYNCVIADNKNTNTGANYGGGAVRAVNAKKLLFKGCRFSKNTSGSKGGAIRVGAATTNLTLDGCIFEGNSAVYGGAVHMAKGTLTITNDTQFNDNLASEKTGGAISIIAEDNCTVDISDSRFFHNRSAYNSYCGGALYIAGASTYTTDVSVTNCDFEENIGHDKDLETSALKTGLNEKNVSTGGAIFLLDYATLKLNRSRFYHNTCSQNGGAVRVRNAAATLYANRCIFDRNYSGIGGAAIHNTSGKIALNNCVFYMNQNKAGDASDATIAITGGEGLIVNTSLNLASSYHGVSLSTSKNSVLANNTFKNGSSGKAALAVESGKTVSSFGHNIWSVLGGDGTIDNTNNDPSTDVVASMAWTWSDPYLTVSSLPAAYYKAGTVDNRAALSELTKAVTYFDKQNSTGFATWLSSIAEGVRNPLNVDVRGYLRPAKIWPGSYQKDATE